MFATSSNVDAAKSVLDCQKYVFGNIVPNTNFRHNHAKSLYLGLEYSNRTITISNITSSPRKKRTLQNTEEHKQNKQNGSARETKTTTPTTTQKHVPAPDQCPGPPSHNPPRGESRIRRRYTPLSFKVRSTSKTLHLETLTPSKQGIFPIALCATSGAISRTFPLLSTSTKSLKVQE